MRPSEGGRVGGRVFWRAVLCAWWWCCVRPSEGGRVGGRVFLASSAVCVVVVLCAWWGGCQGWTIEVIRKIRP